MLLARRPVRRKAGFKAGTRTLHCAVTPSEIRETPLDDAFTTGPPPWPDDRVVGAVEARTVAISRAMDCCVPTPLAAATAGVVIKVLVAG